LSGKIVWQQTGLKYSPVHGAGGSPILIDGELIFGCDGDKDPILAALDASTGEIRWKTPRQTTAKKTFSFCTPLAIQVNGKMEVISPCSGFVGGYDPKDGRELWRVRYGEGYSVVPRPVYAHGMLFLSSGFDAPVLYAVKPQGALGDATDTNVAWTQRKGAPCTPSTLVLGNEIYFVSDGGIATCADAQSGQTYWTERLGGGFSTSPVAAEGRIYFQNESGVGFVVQAGKTFKQLAKNDLAERSLASYAVADGTLYIRTESHLFKVVK
ncbi:MAG TPA: PQQ-binding-like beta-propeller repeat protein, partial [Chthoniobacteraceae bacterium]